MGASGSGGGYFSTNTPEELAKKIRQQEAIANNMSFEANITRLINDLLSNVNNRDTYAIQTHLNTIEKAIHSEIEGAIDLRYAGSVSKHTHVDGLSDIDCLAILDNSELADSSPDEVKEYFYKMLTKKLPNTTIRKGDLAVTVSFTSGIEIQILPAIKTATGLRIPSSRRDNNWSHVVKPAQFAMALRYCNAKMSGKLIPVIKLAKSIISTFNANRQLAGYHVEALAIETFINYKGQHKPREMLKYLFIEGAKNVLKPIKDKSGQSIHVDDYLGEANSLQRKMISDSMSSVGRKMQNADGISEIQTWQQILS